MSDDTDYIDCFKYLPFDDGSLAVLTQGTMKYTRPMRFNDPFEVLPVYPRDPKEIRNQDTDFLDEMIARAVGSKRIPISQRLAMRQKLAHHFANLPGTADWQEQVFGDMGVCCLSRNPFNILMWSHYARLHTGFVVGFRMQRLTDKCAESDVGYKMLPLPVDYSKERPKINWSEATSEMIRKMVLTKSDDWSYEEEERVIEWSRPGEILPYDRDNTLQYVITGAKMDKESLGRLEEIVANLRETPGLAHLRLYEAQMSETKYAIEVPGLPKPKGQLNSDRLRAPIT
ncbi:hypothetical protein MARLIPOL_06149 [Marinobacter lipolyticus SM19]|uniref:DUF2971 domain-containing protein n=1 Tax=Marinobacter lipolyticus SM19 TaxID=1318628 RepID=R8B343_9GAMM|nr:DUF2971 domain-containing protein [Marinobacter lipolyticus]EON93015.1 hypothetical protein MARLIPOL_06149 [Marinobacter lipolyticus SM19]